MLPQQLPGLIYDVNKQCELIFGPGSQVCPYMVSEIPQLGFPGVARAKQGQEEVEGWMKGGLTSQQITVKLVS